MWVWPQVQWATGMANDQRLFVTVSSPLGSLMASKNQAVGQMNFQTEVTGRTVRNTTIHYASKKYFYCLEVTAVTFQKVFTGCVLGTTTTSLEASGSLWTLASSTKALRSHRESWRKDRKSSTALWAVLRYLLCFQSHRFWWCYWKLWGDRLMLGMTDLLQMLHYFVNIQFTSLSRLPFQKCHVKFGFLLCKDAFFI